MAQTKLFLEVSALLTGFTETELRATGMLETYYNTVLQNSDREFVDYFFEDVKVLLAGPKGDIESTLETQFMPASAYGNIAQQLIILWYTGNWGNSVVSSASYIQGLMWDAGQTHPPGAKQPGYGSWAEKPLTVK